MGFDALCQAKKFDKNKIAAAAIDFSTKNINVLDRWETTG